MWALALICVWLLVALITLVVVARLLVVVWQRRKEIGLPGKVVSAFAVFGLTGVVGTALGLLRGFVAIPGDSVEPSAKARALAEGISEAMNSTAFAVIVLVPSIIALQVLTRPPRKGS